MNIVIHKYNPHEGHLGAIEYRACAYIEDWEDPARGAPIPLTLRPKFENGYSRDVVDEAEVEAARAELEKRAGRKLSVRRVRC